MNDMKKLNINSYLIVVIFASSLIIFSRVMNKIVVATFLLFFIASSIMYWKKRTTFLTSLMLTAIACLPMSFISILGTKTSSFPLSWFHVLIIFIGIYIFVRFGVNTVYLLIISIICAYLFVSSMFQPYVIDSLSQLLVIIMFLCSFLICDFYARNTHIQNTYLLAYKVYLASVLGFSLQVIFQYIAFNLCGIDLGRTAEMAQRTAYAGTFGDYSFASLFIATGILAMIIYYFNYRNGSLFLFIINEMLFFLALLITSARTGIVAFILTFMAFIIFRIKKINLFYLILIIIFGFGIPFYFKLLMASRGGNQSVLDGSGRTATYIMSFKYILKNPLFGNGLGAKNLFLNTGLITFPHNFFLQYILQIGFVGTGLLISLLFIYSLNYFFHGGLSKWLVLLVFIGAMFIPDIVSSRYLGVLIILTGMDYAHNKIEKDDFR